jgi:hypothetical protein
VAALPVENAAADSKPTVPSMGGFSIDKRKVFLRTTVGDDMLENVAYRGIVSGDLRDVSGSSCLELFGAFDVVDALR